MYGVVYIGVWYSIAHRTTSHYTTPHCTIIHHTAVPHYIIYHTTIYTPHHNIYTTPHPITSHYIIVYYTTAHYTIIYQRTPHCIIYFTTSQRTTLLTIQLPIPKLVYRATDQTMSITSTSGCHDDLTTKAIKPRRLPNPKLSDEGQSSHYPY